MTFDLFYNIFFKVYFDYKYNGHNGNTDCTQKANNEMARNLIELQFRSLARKSELGFSINTLVERIGFYQKYYYKIVLRVDSVSLNFGELI